jgi:hypothetical protein
MRKSTNISCGCWSIVYMSINTLICATSNSGGSDGGGGSRSSSSSGSSKLSVVAAAIICVVEVYALNATEKLKLTVKCGYCFCLDF